MQCIEGFSILLQGYVAKGNDAKNPAILAFVSGSRDFTQHLSSGELIF